MNIIHRHAPYIVLLALFALVFAALQSGLFSATKSVQYEETIENIRELIEDEMDDEDVVGLSIALIDDQELVWAEGFGYADRKKKIKATPRTVYGAGSWSELFTAAGIFRLMKAGKIDINNPIDKYLPGFSIKSYSSKPPLITIKNILTHHGGFQSDLFKGKYNSKSILSQILEELPDEYLNYTPGSVFSFSSVGLSLLGILIERVTGQEFHKYMNDDFFKPMEMSATSFRMNPAVKSMLSKNYDKEMDEGNTLPIRDVPAFGLYTNVIDMSRYVKTLLNGGRYKNRQIFKPKEVEEILSPLNNGIHLDYDLEMGYGWVLTNLGANLGYAGPLAWHECNMSNFTGRIIMLKKHKLSVIVLSNTSPENDVINTITRETIISALKEKRGLEQPEWEEPELKETLTISQVKKFAGTYATSIGMIEIESDDEDLTAEAMGRKFRLKQNEKKTFSGRVMLFGFIRIKVGPLAHLEFAFDSYKNHQVIVLYRYGEGFLIGEKMKRRKITAQWRQRMGKYRIEDSNGDSVFIKSITIGSRNGILTAEARRSNRNRGSIRALTQKTNNDAVIAGLGRNMGDTIRFYEDRNGKYLRFSGYTFKKVGGL